MLKKALLLCTALASAGAVHAAYDKSLPPLPRAHELSASDIGQHFLLRQHDGSIEQVFYVGAGPTGQPIALSASDVPKNRQSYDYTMEHCLSKGFGWRMPSVHELRVVSQFADEPDPDYLPGGYWTTTNAPCFDCSAPDQFKMVYDVRTGNVRNSTNHHLFKFYPICVYDIR